MTTITDLVQDPADLPFSFVLDGERIHGIPPAWQPTVRKREISAEIMETVYEAAGPGTGLELRVECMTYCDFPVVEWVAWFSNTGDTTAPALSDILALDHTFAGASPVLHHYNGDYARSGGYTPTETRLFDGNVLSFAPVGGRPCDCAFPYYRLAFEGHGLTLAIGWPAQWSANFSGLDEAAHVRAGQEQINARLAPGERIRTPRITLLAWDGERTDAVNLWRRWYRAHILPRPDGGPLKTCLGFSAPNGGVEYTAATEDNQLRDMKKARQHGIDFDLWWIDAGWYPCGDNTEDGNDWMATGNWVPDPERFPNGLKPVGDALAADGAELLLWLEPERVRPGTKLDIEHSEWLLRLPDSENSLLNLGNPACRQWLTEHVCTLIRESGIGIYRQDFNFMPLQYWRDNDGPERSGINENLHVQGYLQYWDELLARNPGLWIDSCASGGRRNDLETMRRAVPLHHMDHGYGKSAVKLAFHRTLFEWIPYFRGLSVSWDIERPTLFDHCVDRFSFQCAMAPMMLPLLDIRRDDLDYELAATMIAIWRRAADLLLHGDYYPLTPFHRDVTQWVAWQFHCPDTGRGLFQAIRLQKAPNETFTGDLQALEAARVYVLENSETGETVESTGAELDRTGFTVALPIRAGAIWFYQRADSPGAAK